MNVYSPRFPTDLFHPILSPNFPALPIPLTTLHSIYNYNIVS